MRNLKKVLAVVLTIALLASMMMVPALAAVSNEDEAKALKAIGLFKGFSETDLGLESNLTREQGIILVIRAMGAEKAALAMTDAEVNAALADVTDANTIGTWAGAENYAAYALSKEITLGVSAEKLVYGGQLDFAADQLVILLLRAMGYEDVTKENCWDTAIAAEFVSAGEAVALDMNNAINRDLAAGVLFTAVKDGVCKDGELLINKLIAAGAVSEDAAVKGGFIAAKPDVLEVESVEATNLIEVVVTFNKDVNEDTVDEADFEVDGDAPKSVDVDGNVVTLTMEDTDVLDNFEDYTLTVEDVEDLDENVIEDTEIDFTVKDVELPELLDIVFTGPQFAKLIFSEPVLEGSYDISIDDGVYTATVDKINGDEVEIDIGTELDEGEHEFKVKGFEDHATYVMITRTVDVEYVDIDEAPEVTIKEASQTKVTLEFDRPVKGLIKEAFYHTYSAWKALDIKSDDKALVEGQYYDEVTLYFTDVNNEKDIPLPEGNVKIVVLALAENEDEDEFEIEDRWGNNLDDDVELYVDITADNTPPAVKKINVEDEETVIVYFTEDVNEESAEKAANIEITDPDGDVVKAYDYTRVLTPSDELTIKFKKVQDEGTYEITLSGIKDRSLSENVMKKVTLSFDIEDKSGVDLEMTKVTSVAGGILYVEYEAEMNTSGAYSVLDAENYHLSNKGILDADDVKITKFTNKIVKITFKDNEDKETEFVDEKLTIGRVKDAKGNLTTNISSGPLTIKPELGPVITAVKKVAENKFELTVDKDIKSVKAAGIAIATTTAEAVAVQSISFVNDGDDTVIKVTTKSGVKHSGTDFTTANAADFKVVVTAGNIKSITDAGMATATYTFGNNVVIAGYNNGDPMVVSWKDGMAPKLVEIASGTNDGEAMVYVSDASGTRINEITLEYTEAIEETSVSKYTYKVGGYEVLSAKVDGTDKFKVILEIKNDDSEEKDDTLATPTVTQIYDIEDESGNEFLEEDSIDALVLGASR